MRRFLVAAALAVVAILAIYVFVVRDSTVEAQVEVPTLAAQIGSGDGAVPVAADGEVIRWERRPDRVHLPTLPLERPPKGGRLKGTALEQVEVLGAVPPPLRRFLAASRYGDAGVEVELSSGIDLIFGDSSQAERKWKAAATILADRSITALDYVNVTAPANPSTGGEGHALPE